LITCYWLPDLLLYDRLFPNKGSYYDYVYKAFKKDFIDSTPIFNGKEVRIKEYPLWDGKQEAFYHITTKDYNHEEYRDFDILRCERIKWIKKFIENHDCNRANCKDCSGIKTWEAIYKKRIRTKILFEEERYIVILEDRQKYYLLITAFYVDSDIRLANFVKEYQETKSAS